MTIRELIEIVREGEEQNDDTALQCMLAACGVIRTAKQGEPSTLEGEFAGVQAMSEVGGYPPTMDGLNRLMADCPNLMNLNVPNSIVARWADAEG